MSASLDPDMFYQKNVLEEMSNLQYITYHANEDRCTTDNTRGKLCQETLLRGSDKALMWQREYLTTVIKVQDYSLKNNFLIVIN